MLPPGTSTLTISARLVGTGQPQYPTVMLKGFRVTLSKKLKDPNHQFGKKEEMRLCSKVHTLVVSIQPLWIYAGDSNSDYTLQDWYSNITDRGQTELQKLFILLFCGVNFWAHCKLQQHTTTFARSSPRAGPKLDFLKNVEDMDKF